jgi:hypothetical protein
VLPQLESLQSNHLFVVAAGVLLDADLFEYLSRLYLEARTIPAYNKFAVQFIHALPGR